MKHRINTRAERCEPIKNLQVKIFMSEKRISRKELTKRNQKLNKKRKNLRTLMIVVVTAVLLYITGLYGASLAYFGDFISSGMTVFQIGGGFPVEDDFSATLQADGMGTGLAVLSPDSFNVYSPTGRNVFTYSHTMQNPVMDTASKRAVIYDLNRTSLKVANGHNILFQQEMENSIIHAEISDSNRIAVTTRSASYNGEVTVFNFNMKQRFVWYCATGFPIYSSLSDSGKMLAVNTVQTVDGILTNDIYVIDAANGQELFTISGQSYPLHLEFISDSRLLIAYTNRLVLWDTKNNVQLASYSFGTDTLQALTVDSRYICAAYGGYSRQHGGKLVLLSKELEEKFNLSVPEKIKDISISSSRVYALGSETMFEYDYSAALLNTYDTGVLSKGLVDYSGTLLINSTSIQKVEKTKSR